MPVLHPELQARLDESAGAPPLHTLPVDVARANLVARHGSLRRVPVAAVEDRIIDNRRGGLRLRIYHPHNRTTAPILVFFHGGGFVIGSIETHDALCRRLCVGTRFVVISVDYALAPEHRFPAGLEDCRIAVQWTADHANEFNGDRRRIVLAGDSAGANLAVASAIGRAARHGPDIGAMLLAYPVVDAPDAKRGSYRERGQGCGLTAESMYWFFGHYLDEPQQARDPLVAPLRSDSLGDLPPTYLITAEFDPLRDEGIEFARKLQALGAEVLHSHRSDANHGFLNWAGTNEPSMQAIDAACAWLTARFA